MALSNTPLRCLHCFPSFCARSALSEQQTSSVKLLLQEEAAISPDHPVKGSPKSRASGLSYICSPGAPAAVCRGSRDPTAASYWST